MAPKRKRSQIVVWSLEGYTLVTGALLKMVGCKARPEEWKVANPGSTLERSLVVGVTMLRR